MVQVSVWQNAMINLYISYHSLTVLSPIHRHSNSPVYSPALGPYLRAAIARSDVDVIFDGEIVSWDSHENRPAPFGSNRSVAKMQYTRLKLDGTLDAKDLNLHKEERDVNVMTMTMKNALDAKYGNANGGLDAKYCSNDQYWLKYVIFDILYVDGPDAVDLISKSRHLYPRNESIRVGSLLSIDLMRRKSILYNLVQPQKNTVELIQSVVVRSDGTTMDANDYFLKECKLEYGKTPCELDSIHLALCDVSMTTMLDAQRLRGKKHEDIEIQRSLALELCYSQIVESNGHEGLVFKDLASPYYLGVKSRSLGYWWKLKADYDAAGQVSDVDVLGESANLTCLTYFFVHFYATIETIMTIFNRNYLASETYQLRNVSKVFHSLLSIFFVRICFQFLEAFMQLGLVGQDF